ncbi:MAG TPA: hypothetical protein VFH31_17390 [Pyrinomonadaceae bacterium]|nr:hypothetical protein [Pyrinomonadaceae bacterium]
MHGLEKDDRPGRVRMTLCLISGLLLWTVCGVAIRSAKAQSLEEKLGTVTEYVPKATAPVDQLVEVAQKFKIPMGIEWVERTGTATSNKSPSPRKRSVTELIDEIASVLPQHCIEVDDGILRIYSPTEAIHPFNFLNIRLKNYFVKEADLFAAENQLRWAIRFTLEPEKYLNGYGGGYGHGANHIFEIPKFTLSGSDLTIRDVLNRIARAQGNALWVATIKSADLEGDEPWRRKGDDEDLPVTSAWHFHPLAEIAELAKEHLAIDVTISGVLDQRMTTTPVMLDHGLAESSGGATGGSSSEGVSYYYAASIDEIGKDFMTVSVHLKVERTGEPLFNFEKKLEVYRDRITEVIPEPRIRIRAYLEGSAKP